MCRVARSRSACALCVAVLLITGFAILSADAEKTYTVGICESNVADFTPTFDTYLNEHFRNASLQVKFNVVVFNPFSTPIDNWRHDFIMCTASVVSCLCLEHQCRMLATLDDIRTGTPSNVYGGVIIARAENERINALRDWSNVTVETPSFDDAITLAVRIAMRRLMREASNATRFSVLAARQVRFRGEMDSEPIVRDVLSGEVDVGIIRTSTLEAMAHRGEINMTDVKVIHPTPSVWEGKKQPFVTSTDLMPEWGAIAMPSVDQNHVKEVARALMSIDPTHWAAKAGLYSGFNQPLSLSRVQSMQRILGLLTDGLRGTSCTKPANLYETITCPPHYFKVFEEEFDEACQEAGLPCPEGIQCVCSPCLLGEETEVRVLGGREACQKMEECAVAEQGETTRFEVLDHRLRPNLEVTYHVFASNSKGQTYRDVAANRDGSPHVFDFSISFREVGTRIVSVFVDGVEIQSSPYILTVVWKSCGDKNMHANDVGLCVCGTGTLAWGDECLPVTHVVLRLLLPPLLVLAVVAIVLLAYIEASWDASWMISAHDVTHVIAMDSTQNVGTSTLIKAELNGTLVAMKLMKDTPSPCSMVFGYAAPCALSNRDIKKRRSSEELRETIFTGEFARLATGSDGPEALLAQRPWAQACNDAPKLTWFCKMLKTNRVLRKEMRFLTSLRHASIVNVVGLMLAPNQKGFLVMEHMECGRLSTLLQNGHQRLDHEFVSSIIIDILRGLRYLHSFKPLPVVHKDLRTCRVLVDSNISAKITIQHLSSHALDRFPSMERLLWQAPEVLTSHAFTPASDVYSFGVMLFEIFAREQPYEGLEIDDVVAQVGDAERTPPMRPAIQNSAGCPDHFVQLMSACWHQNPVERPTVDEIWRLVKTFDGVSIFDSVTRNKTSNEAQQKVLSDVFPAHIAEQLIRGEKVQPEMREVVTIFFSDICGFCDISEHLRPDKVSDMLDRLYTKFDQLSEEYGVFKVETIGDAYMGVTNLVRNQTNDHAAAIARFACAATKAANETRIDMEDERLGYVNIRVGLHSGPVVANVVGTRNPRFCLFGDTVNTASRMESNSLRNMIHVSQAAQRYLVEQAPDLEVSLRGEIDVKGKGRMITYWVHDRNGTHPHKPFEDPLFPKKATLHASRWKGREDAKRFEDERGTSEHNWRDRKSRNCEPCRKFGATFTARRGTDELYVLPFPQKKGSFRYLSPVISPELGPSIPHDHLNDHSPYENPRHFQVRRRLPSMARALKI